MPLTLSVVMKSSAVSFAAPAVLLLAAAVRSWGAARSGKERGIVWRTLAGATLLAGLDAGLILVTLVTGGAAGAGFYLGAAASACLLVAVAEFARRSLRHASLELLVDGLLVSAVVVAAGIWFVVLPGFASGDAVLTYVFLVDMIALCVALVGTVARRDARHRRVGWALTAACAATSAGDALVSVGAAQQTLHVSWVAGFWALAAGGILVAVHGELCPASCLREPSEGGRAWLWARVMLPLGAVLSFPAMIAVLWLVDELGPGATSFFTFFFLSVLVLAFARQAYLIVDNRRAVSRERALLSEAVRRNEELEALTALATTMTETLDEEQIVERGLDALRLGAGAESAALHAVGAGGAQEPRATVGRWPADLAWVGEPMPSPVPTREVRGGREVIRHPLCAHDSTLGVVTLVRRAGRSTQDDRQLIELLTGQLAVAIQNARDYLEKVEQSLRDPLTGLYNRRYLRDVLEKEMHRNERYGSPVSIVLFDVDGFKAVNDRYGHAVGDEVLSAIAGAVRSRIRPSDSFARMGGEEFALLLPETSQLDALAVADRMRRAVAAERILPDATVTISGGVASAPEDATGADEILSKADAALYWAKHNGKNMCAVAGEVVVSGDGSSERAVVGHLYALAASVDRDQLGTPDHSGNVAAHAVAIGAELGLSPPRLVRLRRAALLHDVGKVTVAASILRKPLPLAADEASAMRRHPEAGATMLIHSGLREEAVWVRHHHERVDGAGYPDGLAGSDIPVESRIILVADAFDAMTADRPYGRAISAGSALEQLRRHAGSQFDARVVEAFVRIVQRDHAPAGFSPDYLSS
ncbi:MAG TPA: diguanylate cyclase [Thermoleophilaceae bacterium]